ncbi:MAG: hypothetical protein KDA73_12875 [Rhodobacteraceae bacterium]|nr:hypothetical protein [Paracoccaceae bacterium]
MDEKTGNAGPDRIEHSRDDRLKAALKANLARRKRQVRARQNARESDAAPRDENED